MVKMEHLKVEQIYTGCLSQGAYYIVSDGEAAIIDPLREIKPYLERIKRDNVRLKYIFETHFHADFVSGHIDLSTHTGAAIVYGPMAEPKFQAIIAKDEQIFSIGKIKIKVLHTPGHTMESSCFLLQDEQDRIHSVFTGDTLFIGDVGRPDLAQKAANKTQDELAGLLYDSLRNKIMTLPDYVTVYPAHGAGSACGKNMSKETSSTIEIQKLTNYALREHMTKAEFIKEVTDGLLPPPAYFPYNVSMNKGGYEAIDTVMSKGLTKLSPSDLERVIENTNAIVLDTRSASQFYRGFIPRSINIGLDGQFAPWVGALISDVSQPLILITESGKEEEAITRLARVGFDNILGYLDGGVDIWIREGREIDVIHRITATQLESEYIKGKSIVVDVRREGEYEAEHIVQANNKPLDMINEWFASYQDSEPFYLHCAGGYRSMMAASILKARGIHHFKEIDGGFNAISKTSIPKTAYVCPSTIATNTNQETNKTINHMNQNVGATDKIVRLIIAAVIAVLYFTHIIEGTTAILLGVLALIMLLTSFINFCPLYAVCKISTRTEKK